MVLAGLLLFSALPAATATLFIADQTTHSGETIMMPVLLASGGQTISGVQFDLSWDASLDLHVSAGEQVRASSKVLYSYAPQSGTLRFLVVGMNRNTLTDGELVQIFLTIRAAASAAPAALSFSNPSATTPDGSSVPLQASSGNLQIQAGAAAQFIPAQGILNAASLASGAISPGEILTLFGSISASPVVRFNGVASPVLYVGAGQVNVMVPFGLDLSRPALLDIQQGASSSQLSVPVAPAAPALFTQGGNGTGPGAILNEDYSPNSFTNPAAPGSIIMVYGTGFGTLNPLPPNGQTASAATPTSAPVTATIDGVAAEVIYAGAAPTLVSGVNQINIRAPAGLAGNPSAPISLRVGSAVTPSGVTVSIR